MARVSNDGKWVMGITSDTATGVTFNLDPDTSCIHQNRQWKPLQPRQTRALRGKVYLFQGSLADLWAKHEALRQTWRETPEQEPTPPTHLQSVWAPPTAYEAGQALRARRPKTLPDHPLAGWVADRLARDRGPGVTRADVRRELRGFRRRGRFWVRDDATGLWVSNGQVGLSFLPASGGYGVASLYHIASGTECVTEPPKAGPPWRMRE
jgi:hypothetical protein